MADQVRTEVNLGFFSGAFEDSTALQLIGVRGKEEISKLFEFELLLVKKGAALTDKELEDIVKLPCVLALGVRHGDLVHGVLSSIEHLDVLRNTSSVYVARMVPQVALLDMGQRCGIYQETTVPDMVSEILSAHGLSKGKHFSVLITDDVKSPKREYVVQYQESDWMFIQRWLEHEGYFYWFEHTQEGARLVIADANDDATPIEDPEKIPFRELNQLQGPSSSVWDFTLTQRRVAKQVTVLDYNHRRPTDLLVSTAPVVASGFGHVFHYGEHVKDKATADAMAKIRAELIASDQRLIKGVSDCSRFRVGHVFELEGHPSGYDGKYLITSIEHRAGVRVPSLRLEEAASRDTPENYKAIFTAIPFKTQFRPKRVTPWPRIAGFINGHVEADTGGDYAQIDKLGRYKVKLPFDVGSRKGLSASRWIRMAQAYSGAGYGQHFPLHKGTEVLIAHVDGDPDRPIIASSVPNEVTPGPVIDSNATQSVMQTASGIRVEIEDLQQ
jgi:type VI secretion system secreted protein VgrG